MKLPSQKKKIKFLTEEEVEYGEEIVMNIGKVRCDVYASLNTPTYEGELITTN